MRPKLRLPDVTVCAADSLHPALAVRALKKSIDAVEFGDAVLFCDEPVAGPFRWQKIPRLNSKAEYSRFCLREMAQYIETPFVLVVQWDGYVVNPAAWQNAFLDFDYLGAPWMDGVVGNGGFSLRSRRFLEALQSVPLLPGFPEDRIACRLARDSLEGQHRIRFAHTRLAARFSYETRAVRAPVFGFHGFYNLPNHETDDEVLRVAAAQTPVERATWQYLFPVFGCLRAGRENLAVSLYGLARRDMEPERITAIAAAGRLPVPFVQAGVARLERLLAAGVADRMN